MKISYNWLNEYISLDGISPGLLAEKLTHAGIEIEEVNPLANGSNLVIGEVINVKPHPNSDHLHVVMVNYGEGEKQIVCGALNIKDAKKVIVAKVGAVLPKLTIKKGVIRGEESNGMICSLAELGVDKKILKDEQINGIEILNENAPVGGDPLKYLGLDDFVLEASLTPNRSDCLAMWSIAKEVGAILRRKANLPSLSDLQNEKESSLKIVSRSDNCPIFLGKVINEVKVKPSPKWISDYLHAAGIKSINNLVDISNFVMLETGQPLHFYDAEKLEKREIVVIDNLEGNIETLDNISYKLEKNDLVITCNGKNIGLAGVMGGESSKIDENTKAIIIEAALFNHVTIRNTANRLGLMTESSSRFIKGLEPLAQIKAVKRAVDLLIKYADADEIEETVIEGNIDYKPTVVVETLQHCNSHLGTNYTKEEVYEVLKALDFEVKVEDDTFTCTIPSYRTDLKIPEDLDEEIIRLIGYDSLKTTLPTMVATIGKLDEKQKLERATKSILNSLGISEIVTYSLVKEEYINNGVLPFGNHIKLASPLSDDRKYVRNSLMPSILECVSYNINRKANNVNLFEISSVYEENKMQNRLGIAIYGDLQISRLHKISINADFYVLKGIIEEYLNKCGITDYEILKNDLEADKFHPYRSAKIILNNQLLGIFGEIHPVYGKKIGINKLLYAELLLDLLLNVKRNKVHFKGIDKYPSVSRDISLIVDKELEVNKILEVIKLNGEGLIKNLEVFDVYLGEHVASDKKSVALNMVFQSKEKTLTETDILRLYNNILTALKEKFNAVLRD